VHLKLIMLSLVLGIIFGCGGGQDNSNTTTTSSPNSSTPSTPPTVTLSEYQFVATVDLEMGTPPFPVAVGDTVTGTFTFNPSIKDSHILSTQGGYVQKSPATVQVKLGSITLNADLNNWLGYVITVMDNDASVSPTRDIFSWYVNDTALAVSYGLDYIQAGFSLTDFTATAFSSDAMPLDINSSNYSGGNLFISGSKGHASLWNLRSQITSVTKVQ
jgi:hypothetical protein